MLAERTVKKIAEIKITEKKHTREKEAEDSYDEKDASYKLEQAEKSRGGLKT